jgi:GT2 family glycosyltransferase
MQLLAVVVLYKMQPSQSPAFRTLRAAISGLEDGQVDIKILLYDNTPGGQDAGVLPADVQYKADVENSGLAKAYNYALDMAQEEGFDWLLTLDQDTTLPIDFLCKLCHAVTFVAPLNTVAAIVPCVSAARRVMSPWTDREYSLRLKYFPKEFIGIPSGKVYAINSASTIRVSALKAIGGYDLRFSIWGSDLVMYHRLHCNNFSIFVAGNIHVYHVVSSSDLKNLSTPKVYENALRAEEALYDEYMGRLGHIVILLRMFYRLVYGLRTAGGSLPYCKIVLRFLCRRLFYSRKHRMESWKHAVRRR